MDNYGEKDAKYTAIDALKDLGWAPGLYAFFIGGPSVLSLMQTIFGGFELIPFLQTVVDAFDQFAAYITEFVNLISEPVRVVFLKYFAIDLYARPHWVPFFLISAGFLRNSGDRGRPDKTLWIVGFLWLVMTTMWIGFMPMACTWWMQGIYASLPIGSILLTFLVFGTLYGVLRGNVTLKQIFSGKGTPKHVKTPAFLLVFSIFIVLIFFVPAAFLSLLPRLSCTASLLTLVAFVPLFGVLVLTKSPKDEKQEERASRFQVGFRMLGGFFVAFLVLAANFVLSFAL